MSANGWFQIGLYLLAIFLLTKPLGMFMVRVFEREKTFLDPLLRPIERLIYRLCGVDETEEMRWTEYGTAMLVFLAGLCARDHDELSDADGGPGLPAAHQRSGVEFGSRSTTSGFELIDLLCANLSSAKCPTISSFSRE